jgi:hypothetical protein
MPLDKPVRVERMASAGLMLTADEIREFNGSRETADNSAEAMDTLVRIAKVAETAGHKACKIAECKLKCVAIDLTAAVSEYDADLVARCSAPICDNAGILTAQEVMVSLLPDQISNDA